ncbi:class I SAM-dependent methyltransferase [Salinisphaera sp. SPP-AMP-43]|uniref:class I SAM-dependent methyltransferase n=1 Tax=Salinisphaera sp. SPP-AMP-43 TaxID=3121288 RepID=UPI003C6E66DF
MDITTIDQGRLEAFVGQAINDLSAGYAGVMISLGHRLGLYQALDDGGAQTAAELAKRAGCSERYVREWLNSQVAGGYLNYEAASERYAMSPEQAAVLADPDSPYFIPCAWEVPASMWFDEMRTEQAFRSGQGVPWGEHDHRLYRGVAEFFRNAYRAHLISAWLPALDGVVAKLEAGIEVADVGCGYGHSTLLMAEAFPNSRFYGFDTHAGSIDEARHSARQAGVDGHTSFVMANAMDYPKRDYGLICFFDCLHDMGDPMAAARYAAEALDRDGTVMLVEPYAEDRLEDNISPIARIYYAASTTLCCAHALSEHGPTVLGAQAGQARLAEIFRQAGFTRFRRAAETPFNLILEARL